MRWANEGTHCAQFRFSWCSGTAPLNVLYPLLGRRYDGLGRCFFYQHHVEGIVEICRIVKIIIGKPPQPVTGSQQFIPYFRIKRPATIGQGGLDAVVPVIDFDPIGPDTQRNEFFQRPVVAPQSIGLGMADDGKEFICLVQRLL